MGFKGKFFSSKKSSDSSSPDGGSSSPQPNIFGSASRFEKKKVRSFREEPPLTSVSSGRRTTAKDPAKVQLQKKKEKEKEKEKEGENESDQKGKAAAKPSPTSGASFSPRKIWKGTGFKEGGTVAGSSLSPILASSLGLNRIKTRSGPLPQEAYRENRINGIGSSNLRREGSCSTSSSSATAMSSSSALLGAGKVSMKKNDARGLEKVPEAHASSWGDQERSQLDRTLPNGATLGTSIGMLLLPPYADYLYALSAVIMAGCRLPPSIQFKLLLLLGRPDIPFINKRERDPGLLSMRMSNQEEGECFIPWSVRSIEKDERLVNPSCVRATNGTREVCGQIKRDRSSLKLAACGSLLSRAFGAESIGAKQELVFGRETVRLDSFHLAPEILVSSISASNPASIHAATSS
ncbi:hypothetical protein IEQ34_017198 [Dendrobium chrysotoxum]|uniref:Uncharacterized protein n=1 Tax=Dendrobium chrysotoxum TaxID=161865 RepID=A0AAV7GAL2_DENCH|nr:hypothetical protein IEQ34_017198 [Dendrobium chrysotoxum]